MADKVVTEELTHEDQVFIAKGAEYAKHVHRDHVRKSVDNSGNTPYFTHLEDVARILRDHHASAVEIVAGYLHDAVEDQGGLARARDIEQHFGTQVLEIVMGCTDSTSADPTKKNPWRQRKLAYINGLKTHSASTCRVSAADKISNMRATIADAKIYKERILEIFGKKKHEGHMSLAERREKVLWYHRSIGAVFADRATELGAIAETYAQTLREFEEQLNEFDLSEMTS